MRRWRAAFAVLLYGFSTVVLPCVPLAFHDDDHDHDGGGLSHHDDGDHDSHPHGDGTIVHFAAAISDAPAAPIVLVSAPLETRESIIPRDDGAPMDRDALPPLARGPPVQSS